VDGWLQAVVAACLVAFTVALVLVLLSLRRVAERAAGVLGMLEEELRPLVAQVTALTDEMRTLGRELNREVERVGLLTERIEAIVGGIAGLVTALSGFTRAGQLLNLVVGFKRGLDVFVHRVRRRRGDHHG
jgi:uncharacterized protein YoxC